MKKFLLPATLAAFVMMAVSCQRDLAELTQEIAKCKIVMGYYYGGSGGLNDSANFIYGPDSKLTKVDAKFEYVQFFYSGDNITSRKWFNKLSNELMYVDTIQYSGNNISRIIGHDYGTYTYDSVDFHYVFDYQGDKLVRLRYFEPANPYMTDTLATVVTTNAAGNIEKLVWLDELNQPYDSIVYQFDANPNYFKKVHPHFILFEPFFELHAGFEAHLAYFYSTNNVKGFTIYSNWNYQISYDVDSATNVSGVKMDGMDYMRYKYTCQ